MKIIRMTETMKKNKARRKTKKKNCAKNKWLEVSTTYSLSDNLIIWT
jgi:hypothetical protein